MNHIKNSPKPGDVFTWYNECLKAYTACQVIKADNQDCVEILFLNWIGKEPLNADCMDQIKPLYIDAFFQEKKYCVYSVEPIVPKGFSFVANINPLIESEKGEWGHWEDLGWELRYQIKWEKIPLEKRKHFQELKNDNTFVDFNNVKIPLNITEIDDSNVDFHNLMELHCFPCVVNLKLNYYHPGLSDYIKVNPFITNLTIAHPGVSEIDLRDSFIKNLIINLKDINILYINDDLESLQTINHEAERCYIYSKNNGASMLLWQRNSNSLHPELYNLEQLSISNIKDLDVESIANCYPDLKVLEFNGSPGCLHNLEKVMTLKNLRKLYVNGFNHISMNSFPIPDKMQNLETLQMTAVPNEIGKEVIRLYREKVRKNENFHLSVSALK